MVSGQSITRSKPKQRASLIAKEQANEQQSGLGEPDNLGRKPQDQASGKRGAFSFNTDDGYKHRVNRNRRPPFRKRKKQDLRIGKILFLNPFDHPISFEDLDSSQ